MIHRRTIGTALSAAFLLLGCAEDATTVPGDHSSWSGGSGAATASGGGGSGGAGNQGGDAGGTAQGGSASCGSGWYGGSWTGGSVVTLCGQGFGIKDPVAPERWDTVDNRPEYAGLSDGEAIPTTVWSQVDDLDYESSDPMRHSAMTACYKGSNTEKGTLQHDFFGADRTGSAAKTYVSWWWRTDTAPAPGDHSSKFLRLNQAGVAFNDALQSSWTQMHAILYDPILGEYCASEWAAWPGQVGVWAFHEVVVDIQNRSYRVRVDGDNLVSFTWTALCGGDADLRQIKLGWDGGGNSPPAITSHMAEIYVDGTFRRVMVGNSDARDSVSHWEMQIPQNVWNDTTIELSVEQGSFPQLAGQWVYVIDDHDEVVAGWPKQI